MLTGWQYVTEINRGKKSKKKSLSHFKGQHEPVWKKHRILKETKSNFGTILKKT